MLATSDPTKAISQEIKAIDHVDTIKGSVVKFVSWKCDFFCEVNSFDILAVDVGVGVGAGAGVSVMTCACACG